MHSLFSVFKLQGSIGKELVLLFSFGFATSRGDLKSCKLSTPAACELAECGHEQMLHQSSGTAAIAVLAGSSATDLLHSDPSSL